MDELIEKLTEDVREAIDLPMSQEDALEVVEGVISNLEAVAAGLKDDLKS
jgi:hypothetical protein